MTIHEIEQAITKLTPDELARFRQWFEEFYANARDGQFERDKTVNVAIAQPTIEEQLDKLRGSLKGKGALKALMEEKKRE